MVTLVADVGTPLHQLVASFQSVFNPNQVPAGLTVTNTEAALATVAVQGAVPAGFVCYKIIAPDHFTPSFIFRPRKR